MMRWSHLSEMPRGEGGRGGGEGGGGGGGEKKNSCQDENVVKHLYNPRFLFIQKEII
jgi:hypothetical protein